MVYERMLFKKFLVFSNLKLILPNLEKNVDKGKPRLMY